ncbi:aromatic acid exporter family protein [Kineococcus sp. TRM81007]|uniref:FUSC family protein n=1 Tax=Kineococcus sp. TRM81007 TaxID=2925831 RepID=UPI001F564AAD|nr:FUSC family protein [Kineococcus sp. TRM81007]MCI2240348.1 aromatic acid exporter family protein [Kineococcus sp. TRM81007]
MQHHGHSLRDTARGALFGRWPRLGLALRSAVAAVIAWQIALWLPFAPAETYPYYAPLGAVVGSYTTVRSSVRNSSQAVAGIVLGGVLALAAELTLGSGPVVLAVVVFAATLLAGWRSLGDQRSWVLTAALFVLVVGASDPVTYVLAYVGLTTLGGAVAVAVNTLLPELPLLQSDSALEQLGQVLAEQLGDLAEGLRRDDPPDAEEWSRRLRSVEPVRAAARVTGEEVDDSLRGNLRARWHRNDLRRRQERLLLLGNLAVRVEELTSLLVEVQNTTERGVALDEAVLRQQVAATLTATAAVVREHLDGDSPAERTSALREEVQRLSAAVAAAEYTNERDRQTAGAVVTAVRRCLGVLEGDRAEAEADPEAVAPTPWTLPGTSSGGGGRPRRAGPRWRHPLRRSG